MVSPQLQYYMRSVQQHMNVMNVLTLLFHQVLYDKRPLQDLFSLY